MVYCVMRVHIEVFVENKYAGDGTEQTERLFTDIIGKEAAKKRLLPLKEEL